jgi:hypothetical protein
MLRAGMDIHKLFYVVTVMNDSRNEVVKGKKLESRELEIVKLFKSLRIN